MGRDPDIFEDPLKFIPERFDVETTADKISPFAYIPFSAGDWNLIGVNRKHNFNSNPLLTGSRNCVGQKFAMLEVKSVISKVLRHYELSIENGFEPQDSLDLVIKSKNGVFLKITRRK